MIMNGVKECGGMTAGDLYSFLTSNEHNESVKTLRVAEFQECPTLPCETGN
jgi:hypothetical protein